MKTPLITIVIVCIIHFTISAQSQVKVSTTTNGVTLIERHPNAENTLSRAKAGTLNVLRGKNTFLGNQVGNTNALFYGEFNDKLIMVDGHQKIMNDDPTKVGLDVITMTSSTPLLPAIRGANINTPDSGIGIEGFGGSTGVQGAAAGTGVGQYFGVTGVSAGANNGTNYGVFGLARFGETNYGIYGLSQGGSGSYAGYFSGKLNVRLTAADSLGFRVETVTGENLFSVVRDGDVIVEQNLKVKNNVQFDKALTITENLEVDGEILANSGIKINDVDPGDQDDDIINKTTPLKYFINVNGTFPSSSNASDNLGTLLGEIKLLPYSIVVPAGWLPCEGQELSISTNPALFSLLGTKFGGDGQTNFRIPDMRNAVPNHN